MTDDIYDPLDEYVNTFQPRFEQVAKDTFAQLAKEAQVDVDANRQTCRLLYDAEKSLGAVKSRIGWTTFLCVILWCCAAIGIFVHHLFLVAGENEMKDGEWINVLMDFFGVEIKYGERLYEYAENYAHVLIQGQSDDIEYVINALENTLEDIKENGFDFERLESMKRKVYGELVRDNYSTVSSISTGFITDYFRGVSIFDYFEEFDLINEDYLLDLLNELFDSKNKVVSVINPK